MEVNYLYFIDMHQRDDTIDPLYFAKQQGQSNLELRVAELEKIIKKLIEEGIGGDTGHKEITMDEYNQLTEEEKAKDIVYFIVDN